MKKIRVHVSQIRNHLYAKIPDILVKALNISSGDDIEITFHEKIINQQEDLWKIHPVDISTIQFKISQEVHTMNMYNRIYIPENYRFFFPVEENEFILVTEIGNIKTSLSSNGYISKGLRQWFSLNGPLMPGDEFEMNLIEDKNEYCYELIYNKMEKNL